jgi:1,4-alpha-glucan branching enzyme
LGVSPVLAEQLAHGKFAELFGIYLEDRVRTILAEIDRYEREGRADFLALAKRALDEYRQTRCLFFEELGGDLLGALRDLESSGTLEIATCGATHGYLPLLGREESIALQVELARRVHERHFGRSPRGMWIPEAAYRPAGPWSSPVGGRSADSRPGVEEHLMRAGIRYFLVDSSLLEGGRGVGSYPQLFGKLGDVCEEARRDAPPLPEPERARDTRRSYRVAGGPDATPGVCCFVRDPRTGLQVWSGDHGYPGDPAYLEFHKKSDTGGHRYWRVTGPGVDLGNKAVYDPDAASARSSLHADHFRDLVAGVLRGGPDGCILAAPFDAELFGHWWREGTSWLEGVLERLADHDEVRPVTFDEHVESFPPEEVIRLPEGSWGEGGRHYVWMNPRVDWTWELIYSAEDEVWSLWRKIREAGNELARRAAEAAGRQLLLLCASDWQFLITTRGAADYATDRVRLHSDDLAGLTDVARRALRGETISDEDRAFLDAVETRDDLFPELADVMDVAVGHDDPSRFAGAREHLGEPGLGIDPERQSPVE